MFAASIKTDQAAARTRFDGALVIINSNPLTIETDCLRAAIMLAEMTAAIDQEAEQTYPYQREYLNAYIPSWSDGAHWDLSLPEHTCSYDALLAQDSSYIRVEENGSISLCLRLHTTVDLVQASVTLSSRVPPDAEAILWGLGKLDMEPATTESRVYLNC